VVSIKKIPAFLNGMQINQAGTKIQIPLGPDLPVLIMMKK